MPWAGQLVVQMPLETRLLHPSRPTWWCTQPPAQWVQGLLLEGIKWLGHGTDHPHPPSAKHW
jgi:hypothetical protein